MKSDRVGSVSGAGLTVPPREEARVVFPASISAAGAMPGPMHRF